MLELRTQAFVHPSLARLFSLSTPFAALCGHMFAAHAQSDTTKLISSYCRVLRLLAKGQLSPYRPGGDEIYSFFREAANWAQLLPPRRTFQISARVTSCTDIPSSHLVQIRGRDAICDSIRDARSALGCQPSSCYHFRDLPCWSTLQLQSPCQSPKKLSRIKEFLMHGQNGATPPADVASQACVFCCVPKSTHT